MAYAEARMLQSRTGRFNAPDALFAAATDPQRWNRYTYARNNPLTLVDPSGYQERDPKLCTAEIKETNPNDFHCQKGNAESTGGGGKRSSFLDFMWLLGGWSNKSSSVEAPEPSGGGNPWVPTVAAISVLTADDASVAGVVDDIAIPVVAAVAVATDLTTKTYITYTLTNPNSGQIYVGRTSGFGTPESILARRFAGHERRQEGFSIAALDRSAAGLGGYMAIRGREQQLIDYHGGVGSPGLANAIRGVAASNPVGYQLHLASDAAFGNIAPYSGRRFLSP